MIARPLYKASKTKSSFTWTEDMQEAFENLERHLSSTPYLAFQDVDELFIFYTDAIVTVMGAVLTQVQTEKSELFAMHLRHFQNLKPTILQQNGKF